MNEAEGLQNLLEQQQGRPARIVNPDDMMFGRVLPRPRQYNPRARGEQMRANRVLNDRMQRDIIIDMDLADAGQEVRRGFSTQDKIKMAIAGGSLIFAGGTYMSQSLFNQYSGKDKKDKKEDISERDNLLREYYSVLSAKAYDKEGSKKIPKGVQEVIIDEYGDMAKVFKNNDKLTIAYKGTDIDNLSDLRADAAILTGLRTFDPKFKRAIELFDDVKIKYPESQISVTGHSLGGQLSHHVAGNRDTHSYTFNAGASPLQMGGTTRATNFITGDDSISKSVQIQKRGRHIIHKPEERPFIPIINLQERHSLANFLPASAGGLNPDINPDMTKTDFLQFTEEEIKPTPPSLRRRPRKPIGSFNENKLGGNFIFKEGDYISAEDYVRADLGLFDEDEEEQEEEEELIVKNTISLEGQNPRLAPLFSVYQSSTFTDLNKRPARPFRPQVGSSSIDKNGDGFISKQELAKYLKGYSQQQIDTLYNQLDIDNDGRISIAEIERLGEIL